VSTDEKPQQTVAGAAANWTSVHVSYHDSGGQDGLLLDAVRPLFTVLRDHGVPAYFMRHWRLGPHLRLHFRTGCTSHTGDTGPETFTALVRPAVDDVVGGYLRAHPSTAALDPVALLPLHRRLAEAEGEPGALLPWYTDNTIHEAGHDSWPIPPGSQEAADLLAGFYLDTTEWVFRVLERVRRRDASRLGVAFDLMAATAHAMFPLGIATSFVSFRSHAEGYLCSSPEGPSLRPRWDRAYATQAGTLAARVRAVVTALDGDGEPEGEPAVGIRDWLELLTPTAARAEGLLAAGLGLGMRPSPGDPDPDDADPDGERARFISASPFHQALDSTRFWPQLRESIVFLRFRFAVNCLYLTLTRLGVTPVDRFRLCHWVANAVEDAYGVSAIDMVRADPVIRTALADPDHAPAAADAPAGDAR
jgi:hypothetical protein